MSGYQRVREVEERQHAAGGAPARRHSRPGRLRSNVFVHEDLDVSHEEIVCTPCMRLGTWIELEDTVDSSCGILPDSSDVFAS